MRGYQAMVGACFVLASLLFAPPALAKEPAFVAPVSSDVIKEFDAPGHQFGAGHRGLDYGVPSGTPVKASGAGTISFAGPVAGDGYFVTIDHGDGIETTYSFLSRVDVTRGDTIRQGAVIALSGRGHPGGPDALHFGAKHKGFYIDPAILLGDLDDITDLLSLTPHEPVGQSNTERSKAAELRGADFLLGPEPGPVQQPFGPSRHSEVADPPADLVTGQLPVTPPLGTAIRPRPGPVLLEPSVKSPVANGWPLPELPASWRTDLGAGNFKPTGLTVQQRYSGRPSATQVVEWWRSLSADEKLRADPHAVGRRGDLPSRLRNEANRLALVMEISELEAMEKRATSDLRALKEREMEPYGRQGNMKRYADPILKQESKLELIQKRLKAARHLLELVKTVDDSLGDGIEEDDVFLLDYDTQFAHGDGRAVVALGDPDSARYISVFVPGVGNWLGNYSRTLDKAQSLFRQTYFTRGAKVADQMSTIAWLGYDTPQSIFDAIESGEAIDGARRLEQFVARLRQSTTGTREGGITGGGSQITVMGHSYGSSTSALAAKDGMAVENLVLIASPGAMTSNVRDFVGAERVWVARSLDDPIAIAPLFAFLGDDPTGSHFDALHVPVCCDRLGHGGYFAGGTRSLRNLTRIVLGEYDGIG